MPRPNKIGGSQMALLSPPSPPPPLAPPRRRFASPALLAVSKRPSFLLSLPHCHCGLLPSTANERASCRRRCRHVAASLGQDEPGVSDTAVAPDGEGDSEPPVSSDGDADDDVAASVEQAEASPEDLENILQVKRVLELLQKNRDMTFGEVKLTIMIEDPRDVERKRLLGIEDPDEITRDDLADALVEVNEGRIPENRVALQLLAKEMTEWPDLEIEAPKKKSKPGKSVYAKATDTGIDPEAAAKRLNIDWDSAADLDDEEEGDDEAEVPSAVGYSALYLLTAFPVIIGISVVLILFYNSLQ
ncbi:protein CHLOROPLAST ENHANCING STRESS TOLERANCE, chloroplastic [Oryza brachyantha]|uniref:Protein CHLOROPLAST ENHANCING STRESS TOLERANCE, chloroplastic n=1 Tax=Oryza brachyantha TaxID=4533 RepID=J3L4W7_ORYBR|nr:protein CHLOROPLAST ENHANCING STRESS TOLERANCE, chloroplastic [Oryza brachyantha]